MIISLIAAMSKNRVIGKNNSIPWKLPEDMRHFKRLTLGKTVVMGRKTFESIGKPLPKRVNIVITRDRSYMAKGCFVVNSVKDALKIPKDGEEVMVIGGSEIYRQFLPFANVIYLTIIEKNFDGDSFFPEISRNEWKEIKRERQGNGEFQYSFVTLKRVR